MTLNECGLSCVSLLAACCSDCCLVSCRRTATYDVTYIFQSSIIHTEKTEEAGIEVMHLTCVWEVLSLNLTLGLAIMTRGLWVSSVPLRNRMGSCGLDASSSG